MQNVNNLPVVALVGLANSGKSTLFNRITHSAHAVISEIAHTTRDVNRKPSSPRYGKFLVVDTAGHTKDKSEIAKASMAQLNSTLELADVIIFVIDGSVAPTGDDIELAKIVRKHQKPTFVATNKADDRKNLQEINSFRKLGFDDISLISAIHGDGVVELIEKIKKELPQKIVKKAPTNAINVAIVGRVNVGKSSLLNALAGQYLAIESGVGGTTRDTNEYALNYKKTNFNFVDTAGLRRPGKIAKSENIEFYSKVRTQKAIDNADVCLMLIDANEPATSQDLHLLGLAKEAQKGVIIVVTKWDQIEKDDHTMAQYTATLKKRLQFVWWAPVIFTSAKTRQNLDQLLELIMGVKSRMAFSLSTPKLNRFLEDANAKNPPSAIKTKKPKVNYITQTGSEPPVFTIFATHPEYMHWSYTRFLENQLREQYDLSGVPVTIEYKSKYKEGNRDRYKKK